MPVPYSAVNLKARFETGDIPTQQDFADLIDTMFALFQQFEAIIGDTPTLTYAHVAWNTSILVAGVPQEAVIVTGVNVQSFLFHHSVSPTDHVYRLTFVRPFQFIPYLQITSLWHASSTTEDPVAGHITLNTAEFYLDAMDIHITSAVANLAVPSQYRVLVLV